MKYPWLLLSTILLLPAAVPAQTAVPAGSILPIQMEKGLNASHARPGQEIRARVTQDIPGTKIRRGTEVFGKVVQVSTTSSGTKLELRFDAIEAGGQRVPLTVDLRALASPSEISSAEIGDYGPDGGIGIDQETTHQIGGEDNYRGGRLVRAGSETVGKSVGDGVLAQARTSPGERCRSIVADNQNPQALWLFSTDACGVYGYDFRIEHAGRTDPRGDIVLTSDSSKLNVNSGTGMLLRVQGS
jgi:hypothetical protein